MRRIIFLLVVILGLAIIAFLAGRIYLTQSQVLGENISINPISKEDVVFPNQDSESDLKNFYEPEPDKNITKKPGWLPLDYTYTITVNKDSLNERFDYSQEKDSHLFRIVTIGDSFTYGQYVDTKENYPERLEHMFNDNSLCKMGRKFEVINLGFGGYDIEYSVYRFEVRGQKYNPDLVLWFVKDDDFFLINEILRPRKKQYQEEIEADEAMLKRFYSEGNFNPGMQRAVQEMMGELGEEKFFVYNNRALEKMRDHYKGKLVFITFSGWLNGSYLSMLQSFINERSNTYYYDGLSSPYDHFADWHPTGKGYAQIAGEIFDYLKQNGLVPCGSL